jgi:HrpA-like RNA helicase
VPDAATFLQSNSPNRSPSPANATRSWRPWPHQVIIVCGETGSGKTTQLPKIALAMGRGKLNYPGARAAAKLIGHTQPRRIAASSVAKRIAEELKTPLGEVVGFKVRFQDRLSATPRSS